MAIEAIKEATRGYNGVTSNSVATNNVVKESAGSAGSQNRGESFSTAPHEDTAEINNNISTTNNMEAVKKAVEKINSNMENSMAQFGIHEATNRIMIKIVDKNTKEVIKEFPPEKTLDMIAKAWELAGILVDEKR